MHHAYETYGPPDQGPLLLTCEHASPRVPAPLRTSSLDRAWLRTHWGYDIGTRTMTRELARLTGSHAVLSRFSRLVCDPNRPPDHSDFVRTEVEGTPLTFNAHIDDAEVERRRTTLHAAYHDAVDRALTERIANSTADGGDLLLLSVHSFTPIWNHRLRTMDIGVLFDRHESVAERLNGFIRQQGYDAVLNEPYSGRRGMIYAADRHGRNHGVVYLEIEINQSLCCTPARARRVARHLAAALKHLEIRRSARL